MTKAALCVSCADIVAPYRDWRTDHRWRWCECDHIGVRWRDGARGLIEVTALHGPDTVRVIGINNSFLGLAVTPAPQREDGVRSAEQWRALHDYTCSRVEPHYLFHADQRNCWALIVKVGESGDVIWVDWADVRAPSQQEPRIT